MFNQLNINLKVRLFEGIASRFIVSMILPFMTLYFANHFGIKVANLMLFIGVIINSGTSLISCYLTGIIGRKVIIVIAESVRTITFFFMMISNSSIYESSLVTLIMMINGFCTGLSEPASQAMVEKVVNV